MPRILITMPDKDTQPYRFGLERKVVTFGRSADNDIVLDTQSVSGSHAEMRRVDGGYVLANQGSTNGMKLKGRVMKHIVLNSGMRVEFGEVIFDFSLSPEELEVLNGEKGAEEDFKGPARLPPVPPREEPVKRSEGNTRNLAKDEPWEESSDDGHDGHDDHDEEVPRRRERSLLPSFLGSGVGLIVLFIIAALICAAIGFAIRHHQESDGVKLEPGEGQLTDQQS